MDLGSGYDFDADGPCDPLQDFSCSPFATKQLLATVQISFASGYTDAAGPVRAPGL